MMGTEIFKIDAEMAEKIEVEVGNPHLKSDRAVSYPQKDSHKLWHQLYNPFPQPLLVASSCGALREAFCII